MIDTAAMTRFLIATEPLGPAGKLQAFRDALRADRVLVDEPPGDTSDGYAVALFGIQAISTNELNACQLWLHLARTQIGGWPGISHEPALRTPQITWAIHILEHQRQSSRENLTQACKIILTLSSNPNLTTRARDFARAQGLPVNTTTTA